jgi:hypothetical protein
LRKPEIGDAVWNRFSKGKKGTLWYYGALAEIFCELLRGQPGKEQLAKELRHIVGELHKDKSATVPQPARVT